MINEVLYKKPPGYARRKNKSVIIWKRYSTNIYLVHELPAVRYTDS